MKEENATTLLAYHSATVPGLSPYQMPKKHGLTHHVHFNLLSSFGRQQGTVRALSSEQMNRYRHLLPLRLMAPHHQFQEGTTATAVQRMASFSPFVAAPPFSPLSAPPSFPIRTHGAPIDHRPSPSGNSC